MKNGERVQGVEAELIAAKKMKQKLPQTLLLSYYNFEFPLHERFNNKVGILKLEQAREVVESEVK